MYVSRYLGHDAICIAILVYRINQRRSDWFNLFRGGHNLTVALRSTPRVNFDCGIVATVDRLNNTTRVSATKECSPGPWLTINNSPCTADDVQ